MLSLKDWLLVEELKNRGTAFSDAQRIIEGLSAYTEYPTFEAEGDIYGITREDEFSSVFKQSPHLKRIDELYYALMHRTWTDNEIAFTRDREDFESMEPSEQNYVKMNLAYFLFGDGVIIDNIGLNDQRFIKSHQVSGTLGQQTANEGVHERTYTKNTEVVIADPVERDKLFTDIFHFKSVGMKIRWAKKWIEEASDLRVAFLGRLITEAIQFSSAFACLFWLKSKIGKNGKSIMNGTTHANDFIFQDESIHRAIGIALLDLFTKLPQTTVYEMIKSAVDTEIEFVNECLPEPLERVDAPSMCRFVEFVADTLLVDLGYDKLYNSKNTLSFMDMTSAIVKTNFFERKDTYTVGRGNLTHSTDIDPALDIFIFEKQRAKPDDIFK